MRSFTGCNNRFRIEANCQIIRLPDVSREGLKFYPWTFFFIFLSIHRAQQPRSRWPSNVFQRFGGRWHVNNWYRDLAYPSPNFHWGGGQKCDIWRRLKHHSTLSWTRLKMQQDIRNLKQKCNAAMIALCTGQAWWSWVTHHWDALSVLTHPLKLHAKIVNNSAVDYSISLKFCTEFERMTLEVL